MAAETLTPFHGDRDDENPEDFLRAFYRRMGDKTDEYRKSQFKYYLQADSIADEWYADLLDDDKKSWADIETAFAKRWPRKKLVKKTDDEYEDEILGRKLKTEDLGKKEKIAGREVYTHIAWADKMATTVKSAKLEKTTTYIRQVRKELPSILREKIGTSHTNWDTFLQAVRDVDLDHIKEGVELLTKELEEKRRSVNVSAYSRPPPDPQLRRYVSSYRQSRSPISQ